MWSIYEIIHICTAVVDEAIIFVLVFVKDEFTLRKQCKTGVIVYIAD